MKRIYIIGAGPGHRDILTVEAQKAIENSDCVIAHGRLIREYEDCGKMLVESASAGEIAEHVAGMGDGSVIAILVSGDTGFYSLAKQLTVLLREHGETKLISGVSSIAYFCARIGSSWDDALLLSLHGREVNIVDKVRRNKKVIMLTDTERAPERIAKELCENGLGDAILTVGENLSYGNERITAAAAKEAARGQYGKLCVLQIENPHPAEHTFIDDSEFIRGDTPMTKQEIRCLSVNKLRVSKRDVVYDVGAGTGSVSVEIALQIPDGKVYALEKDAAAIELLEANKRKFHAGNIHITSGNASAAIPSLPAPDKVFIGGSGGELAVVLDGVYKKNAGARVVINVITLETLCEAIGYYKKKAEYTVEVIQAGVNFAREAGEYRLITAQNPVYIITAARKEAN